MALYLQFAIDAVLLGGIYTLMAIGLSLSLGVTHLLNFAHGEAVMLGAYGAFWLFTTWHLDPILMLPVVMMIGFAGGLLQFNSGIRSTLNAPYFNQLLLTFGMALILQNVAVILWHGDLRSASPSYALNSIDLGTVFIPTGRLIGFALAASLTGLLFVWLRFTYVGRAVRAIAQNRDAATLLGINVPQLFGLSFAISTALAAASGVILSLLNPISPFLGLSALTKAVEITILGGIGSLPGTVLSAFLLGMTETGVAYFVPDGSGWADGVGFAILFAILALRPRGILGRLSEV
jgi:branched-chain amino acid transport system permease protein